MGLIQSLFTNYHKPSFVALDFVSLAVIIYLLSRISLPVAFAGSSAEKISLRLEAVKSFHLGLQQVGFANFVSDFKLVQAAIKIVDNVPAERGFSPFVRLT